MPHNRENQIYEEYWNYTAAFTDFNGLKFRNVLKACLDFIDAASPIYSPDKYRKLQEYINTFEPVDDLASQRKRINQLVKLGFIQPYLAGYPKEAREYISANSDAKRQSILSKIVYKYANFCNATTEDKHIDQLAFFLRSLEEIGLFSEVDLATIMTIDIDSYPKGYVTKEELAEQFLSEDIAGFMERKRNQVGHLGNLLSKLDDLVKVNNVICYATDAEELFGPDPGGKKQYRDPYLQRIYKKELEEESRTVFGSNIAKCMLEGIAHPVLIASHIKPYKVSEDSEAFDVNNGLLLSKNTDSLFDLGYMTFNEDGIIVPSRDLHEEIVQYLSHFVLKKEFINDTRMEYMKYHREFVFEKRYSQNRNNAILAANI